MILITYFPVLKLSNSEMGALGNLKSETKDLIVPIIESKMIAKDRVQEWWTVFNTLGSYLSGKIGTNKFVYDYSSAFEKIGEIQELKDTEGLNIAQYCNDKLEEADLNFIPCVHFDSPSWLINSVLESTRPEVAVRVRCHDFSTPMEELIIERIQDKIFDSAPEKEFTIILDFYNMPINQHRINSSLKNFSKLSSAKLVLLLTNCPEDADEASPNSFTAVRTREDYSAFKIEKANYPNLNFGDYTVRLKPGLEGRDINYYNTYLKIFYTTESEYYIGKSSLIDKNGIETFINICKDITESDVYSGSSFSYGDQSIEDCANSKINVTNHSKPIEFGINHHIELTARQVSLISPVQSVF
jgi:hypothetical protein